MVISSSRRLFPGSWVADCSRANLVFSDSDNYFCGRVSCIRLPTPSRGPLPQRTLPFLSQLDTWHPPQPDMPAEARGREPLHLTLPPGTHPAGGSARGGDATVTPAPGAARRAAQVPRFRDRAGKCQAGAAGAEPGTAFARAEAEAGAFGGRDRGNPETPGPHQLAAAKAAGAGKLCASGVAGDPAGLRAGLSRRPGCAQPAELRGR